MMVSQTVSLRTNQSIWLEWWRTIDRMTFALFLALLIVGVLMSMAASPAAATRLEITDSFYFLKRHIVFAGLGLLTAVTISFFSPINARRIGVLALLGAIALMCCVIVTGAEVKGSTRWLRFGSFSLQPSEFLKPAFIVFTAWLFAAKHDDNAIPAFPIIFGVFTLCIILLIRQPDFGQSFLLTLCFGAIMFFAGMSLGVMLVLLVLSLVGSVGAYFLLPHVQARIHRFLGSNGEESYQTERALEAIRQGGLLGRGPGEGAVKFSLPDGHTDFIFAVTVEEFGFLISLFVIVLLGGFVIRVFRNALKLTDYFSQIVVAGLATLIGMQTVINLCVNLNMIPAKGMTLPFISYGGSSLLSLCFATGLILAFTRRRPGAYAYGD